MAQPLTLTQALEIVDLVIDGRYTHIEIAARTGRCSTTIHNVIHFKGCYSSLRNTLPPAKLARLEGAKGRSQSAGSGSRWRRA